MSILIVDKLEDRTLLATTADFDILEEALSPQNIQSDLNYFINIEQNQQALVVRQGACINISSIDMLLLQGFALQEQARKSSGLIPELLVLPAGLDRPGESQEIVASVYEDSVILEMASNGLQWLLKNFFFNPL